MLGSCLMTKATAEGPEVESPVPALSSAFLNRTKSSIHLPTLPLRPAEHVLSIVLRLQTKPQILNFDICCNGEATSRRIGSRAIPSLRTFASRSGPVLCSLHPIFPNE